MTKKQAYCCLNCSHLSPPCDGAIDCNICCEDCGDTSACKSSAYFKDGSFYLNHTTTITFNLNANFTNGLAVFEDSGSGTSTYTSKQNKCLSNSSYTSSTTFDDGDQFYDQTGCGGTECYGCSCSDNEECWTVDRRCGPDCCGTSSASCDTCIDDECPGFNSGCNGLECICTSPEDDCEGTYETANTAKITFEDPVKLYNKEGQDVGNIIGATYDPCAPCEIWSAPACHFFAP